MARKKVISAALAAMLMVSSVFDGTTVVHKTVQAKEQSATQKEETKKVVSQASQVNGNSYGLCDNTKDGAILHAWCWSFNTIKENLKDIAEAGFTTVQTSPANECLKGENGGMSIWSENGQGKWEYHYQPTDWKIGNYQLGTREEFTQMCEEADKYGVKIIVDVLPNHTTPQLGAVSKSLIEAAGGQDKLYHAEGFNSISQWEERFYCTNGAVLGLPDVNTENPGFQKYYLNYLNDLIDCGVDGFRYDTAKHIGLPDDPQDEKTKQYGWKNNFWPVALGNESVDGVSLHNKDKMFIYGEVLQSSGSRDGDYGKIFHLTGSGYGGALRGAVRDKNFSTGNISDWRHATPSKIVTWVESHDTYCNHHESGFLTDWDIRMCWAIIAARSTGTPLFYSRPDGSNGSQGNYWGNNRIGAKGNDQFKAPEVVACNHFRNAMAGESEYMSNFGGNDCLVIERGNKGAVIINMGSQKSNVKLSKVADGTYTEEVSGQQVQVSGGVLKYDVPAGSVAVVYDAKAITKDPSVSVSKDSGTFTKAFDLTLTPQNATKATYSVNGGDAVEFTSKKTVTIGEGCSVGDKVTVKVTATGEGTPFEKTFTYTMVDIPAVPDAKFLVRVKKSDFSSAPYIYAFAKGGTAKEYAGKWPGTKLEDDGGDYYIFKTDDTDSATVILHDNGSWRNTEEGETEVVVTGKMDYDKGTNKFTKIEEVVKTPVPTQKETPTPEPKETPIPTSKDTPTPKPTQTPTATPKPGSIAIEASKANGAQFTEDTMDVKLTLTGATEGTYSVDDGPEKNFKSGDTVKVGQGKIADTDVKLKVTATSGNSSKSTVFTYKKVFDGVTSVKTSAIHKMEALFKVVEEAAQVDAAAETGGMYATNPNGVGKAGNIKIDGDCSDWTSDMLVAQCGAWDVANVWKGAHENCLTDCYGLYASWDDSNLYIGMEMVNTTDTWQSEGNGSLLDNGEVGDLPIMLALNVGNKPAMSGKVNDGKGVWGLNINFETKVDHLLLMSGKVGLGEPSIFSATGDDGAIDYKDKENTIGFKTAGIEYMRARNSVSAKIMHLENSSDVADAYDASKYKDALASGHNRKWDSFYEIKIPFEALGIDKAALESNGVGVMQIATRGQSAIDCIPHDPAMLDNVKGDYSQDPSTSEEKEDLDIITVPLAAVGNAKAGGEGSGPITIPTKAPTATPDATKVPTVQPEGSSEPTEGPTKQPENTKAPEDTKTPENTKTPEDTAAPTVAPGVYTVNFGADRSAPQLSTTELTLKAIGYGSEGYQYQFLVDGKEVQKSSTTDTYKWKGTAGTHTIKVVVTDNKGKTVSSEKTYVIEQGKEETVVTNTPEPTIAPEYTPNVPTQAPTMAPPTTAPTNTPVVTAPVLTNTPEPTATPEPVKKLAVSVKVKYASPRKAGQKNTLSITASGGTAPYTYVISVKKGSAKAKNLLNSKTKKSVSWTPTQSGKYTLTGKVTDASGKTVTKTYKYEVSSPVSVKKFKVSKSTIKVGKKLTITANATSIKSVKYQFEIKKNGAKKATVLKKYGKSKTCTVQMKKKGTYYIYLKVKDTYGNTKTVKKKVIVKK